MKMKKIVISILLATSFTLSTTTLQAGVPVTDSQTAILNGLSKAEWLEQAARWAETAQKYKDDIEWYQKQYNNLRSGNYFGLITDIGGKYFTQGGTIAGISFGTYSDADGEKAAEKYLGKNDSCAANEENGQDSANYKACRAARNRKAQSMAEMEEMMHNAEKRTTQIQKLISAISTKRSAGELQQAQLEMQGLQALLQNDLAKIQLTLKMQEQREVLYKQEQKDHAANIMQGNGKEVSLGDFKKYVHLLD